MVQKSTPIQPQGVIGAPPTMYFQKMQFLGVFRPFLQRSLPNMAFEGFSTYITFVQPFVLVKGQNMPFESICPGVGLVA